MPRLASGLIILLSYYYIILPQTTWAWCRVFGMRWCKTRMRVMRWCGIAMRQSPRLTYYWLRAWMRRRWSDLRCSSANTGPESSQEASLYWAWKTMWQTHANRQESAFSVGCCYQKLKSVDKRFQTNVVLQKTVVVDHASYFSPMNWHAIEFRELLDRSNRILRTRVYKHCMLLDCLLSAQLDRWKSFERLIPESLCSSASPSLPIFFQ